MTFDDLFQQEYDRRRNNCLHFTALAWKFLTGDDRLDTIKEHAFHEWRGIMRKFTRQPGVTESPSVALMETVDGREHIGICYRRRLLHLTASGVQFFPVEAYAGDFVNLRFYQ